MVGKETGEDSPTLILLLSLLLSVSGLAQGTPRIPQAVPQGKNDPALTVEQILEKYIAAVGGKACRLFPQFS